MLRPDGVVMDWAEIVDITHRRFHDLPAGVSPGLTATHILQVPTGLRLPENGRVQMYPCFSFEFHLVLVVFDPVLKLVSVELHLQPGQVQKIEIKQT